MKASELVKKVALEINRPAFNRHMSLYRFCINNGDTASEAKDTADWAHGAEIKEALDKAASAIMAMQNLEPSQEVVDRFEKDNCHMTTYHCVAQSWAMMIDAALSESE